MASEQTNNESQQPKGNEKQVANTSLLSAGSFRGMLVEQYRKAKENAEAYPYVWGSYLIVYGGFGLWMAYRYRKLRKTEDRVRALQEKLGKLRLEREPTSSAKVSENVTSSISKPTK